MASKTTTPARSEAEARRARQAWNRGMVGEPTAPRPVPPAGPACCDERCGRESARGRVPAGMVRVRDHIGVARMHCEGWCALYAQALADVKGIRPTHHTTTPSAPTQAGGTTR